MNHILYVIRDSILIDSGRLLDGFLVDFRCQVESQVDQKIDHMASCWQVGRSSKKAKKLKENQGFLVSRPSNFEAKFNKKRPKTDQNSSKNLDSILIQFLMDFGGQLGSKILPKPGPNRGKSMKDGLPNQ